MIASYSGSILDGTLHGKGAQYANNEQYDGEWYHGKRHGQGCILTRMDQNILVNGRTINPWKRYKYIC